MKPARLGALRNYLANFLAKWMSLDTFKWEPSSGVMAKPGLLGRNEADQPGITKGTQRHTTSSGLSYLKNLCRSWRLHGDQEKTPLRPASVGDMMLPSDFLHMLPSPSWTMPKLRERETGPSKRRTGSKNILENACRCWGVLHVCMPVGQKGNVWAARLWRRRTYSQTFPEELPLGESLTSTCQNQNGDVS